MKIRVCRIEDGPTQIEVIDPSDGAVAQQINLNVGEEVTIVATTANSPADIEVGETTRIQDGEPETEAAEGEQNAASTAEGAEETASGSRGRQAPTAGTEAVNAPDEAA